MIEHIGALRARGLTYGQIDRKLKLRRGAAWEIINRNTGRMQKYHERVAKIDSLMRQGASYKLVAKWLGMSPNRVGEIYRSHRPAASMYRNSFAVCSGIEASPEA